MAQKLILPINNCQLNAGYKMARYKQQWGFAHYGADFIELNKQRTVYALGDGVVVAAGMDGATPSQRLGNCVVVVYKAAELPDGRIVDLACRMFHLDAIDCRVGEQLRAGSIIGQYGSTGAHSSGPHLHLEFDSDVKYPQYAFGLAQSGNIIKKGGVDSTIDPCKVLWLGEGQRLTTPQAWIDEGWVSGDSLRLPKLPQGVSDAELTELREQLAEAQKEQLRLSLLMEQIRKLAGG